MTSPPLSNNDHQDIWESLPWLVNGRLGASDRRRAEVHLRLCSECRVEYEAQRRVHEAMCADTGVEWAPAAGLNKLRQRIRSGEGLAPAMGMTEPETAPENGPPAFVRRRAWARPVGVAASCATAALAIAVLAMGYRYQTGRQSREGSYRTVTSAAPQQAGAAVRAVFAPTVTLSELQAWLEDAQLRIVSGPTEAGVYSLASTGPQSVDWSLRRLRGHETVRFAEAIGAATASPTP